MSLTKVVKLHMKDFFKKAVRGIIKNGRLWQPCIKDRYKILSVKIKYQVVPKMSSIFSSKLIQANLEKCEISLMNICTILLCELSSEFLRAL